MNPNWLGDSYDNVKRFLVGAVGRLGFTVCVDTMPTGEWLPSRGSFFTLIGATDIRVPRPPGKTALLIDPDTGIGKKPSPKHTTVAHIISQLELHQLVFTYDQSFSRGRAIAARIQDKLGQVHVLGAHAFYYDSHARFLFCARSREVLEKLELVLLELGLPASRLVHLERAA